MYKQLSVFIALIMVSCSEPPESQLEVARIFGDHMVLQRDKDIAVWGWDHPGAGVSVNLGTSKEETTADESGKWKVSLPAMTAGGPYELQVSSGDSTVAFKDVMIGDVYLCSGQSNMEWTVENANNAEEEIANSNYPEIRHFKVPLSQASTPQDSLAGGSWEQAGPETTGQFTAVGYYFAKNIIQHENVAVGLINSSWGGSRVEPWMSKETLEIDDIVSHMETLEKEHQDLLDQKFTQLKEKFPDINLEGEDPGMEGNTAVWADPELKTSDWADIEVPSLWEDQGYEGLDGYAWYRNTFELTEEEANAEITLGLGQVDDTDYLYINGKKAGETFNLYNKVREYTIPPALLQPGVNVIAVRVQDTGGGGGIYGDPANLFVRTGNREITLAGTWKFNIGTWTLPQLAYNQLPTLLYNKMIYPIQEFPVAGVLWYQGESNAENTDDATAYADLFQKMISQWREDRKDPELPFMYVQLANFMAAETTPEESDWAILRESQSKALNLDNTAQAVIIDIGEANDIHPRNKQDVGYRLSLAARNLIYGEDVVFSGPVYSSQEIDGNKILLSFDHVAQGLKSKNGGSDLHSFAIAGADKKFYRARAKINGNKVEVWSNQVANPLYVRYAWANNPEKADLYNSEGLPASPFRTDNRE